MRSTILPANPLRRGWTISIMSGGDLKITSQDSLLICLCMDNAQAKTHSALLLHPHLRSPPNSVSAKALHLSSSIDACRHPWR